MMKDFFVSAPAQYFSKDQINAVKGILILSVMVGHLRSLAGVNLDIFQFVYNFHVICFLLLPFIYPVKQVNKAQILTWVWRFFVPFSVFFIAYGALNALFLGADYNMADIFKGYFVATPDMIDMVTGSKILWFLPHIFLVFVVFSLVMTKCQSFAMVLSVAFLCHIFAGFIDRQTSSYIPFTGINLLYLFFLGCVLRMIVLGLKESGKKYALLFFTLFLVIQFISIYTGNVLGYTGMYLFDITSPAKLFLCDALIISAMLFLLYSDFLSKMKFLNWIGQHSLIIFLVHQPFLFIAWKTMERVWGQAGSLTDILIYGAVSFSVSLILSVICVLFFKRYQKINTLIFPRSFDEWKQVFTK